MLKASMFAVLPLFVSGAALAADLSAMEPERVVEVRQEAFKALKSSAGELRLYVLGKKDWQQQEVDSLTGQMQRASEEAFAAFLPGTLVYPTEATAAVEQEPERFKQAQANFQKQLSHLQQVVSSGDQQAAEQALGQLNRSCKSCHNGFKQP